VAVLTLDRPEALNAFTPSMADELERAVRAAVADRDVFGLVLTGAGRGFCAGLDAAALAATAAGAAGSGGGSTRAPLSDDRLPGLFSTLLEQPKPIVAAVNGVAAGGGFILAAKCDLRFASTEASFTVVFSKRGLIAEHGLTWLLPRQVGLADALDLMWSSRRIDAAEALRIGLVQRVVPAESLLDEAVSYLTELAEQVSPASVADTKRLVYAHTGVDIRTAFVDADEATWQAVRRPDATEGVASFVERRPPRFEPIGEGS
jgi:enoyl-CoA hydratase/carnithine racemase